MFLALCIFISAHLFWAAQAASNSSNTSVPDSVSASWYASWHLADVPLESVNWTKYTRVYYSFATTTEDVNVLGLADSDKQLLPEFVQAAHQNGVCAWLSVGGWTGSRYFSTAVATDENRTAFANTILNAVTQYQLDGIEFDWEYPGKQGIGCNIVSPDDSTNFLLFLQKLRSIAPSLYLSAAVSVTPFLDSAGNPMTNVSQFADVLNNIELMNYDIWGSWSATVGPNAPLNDTCAPTPAGSAVSAVQAWTAAGFPAEKIILGVASYGHSFHVEPSDALDAQGNLQLYPPFNKTLQPAGDKWDGTAGGVDECGNANVVGGIFDFWGLIDGGFLAPDGTNASGIYYKFDGCSQTPFVYNLTSEVMVSYDNPDSFGQKGQFIRNECLAGFAMWQTAGDSNNLLLDAIRLGAGMT